MDHAAVHEHAVKAHESSRAAHDHSTDVQEKAAAHKELVFDRTLWLMKVGQGDSLSAESWVAY
jgi:hypothetical protein